MAEGRHCKHGLHVAEGCAICFGSESKIWRGTVLSLAYELGRDIEPEWMHDKDEIVCIPAADHDALTQAHTHALNLLAVLHGDGGHYTAEHGFEKSCKDAEAVYYEKLTAADKRAFDAGQALAEARAELQGALVTAIDYKIKVEATEEQRDTLRAENERLRAELASLKRGRIAVENLVKQQAQIPPEFAQVLDDNFWNLV